MLFCLKFKMKPFCGKFHKADSAKYSNSILVLVLIWCNIGAIDNWKEFFIMARQSISITKPNTDWLKSQIDRQEYISMTDAVNDLIRQARRKEEVRIEKIRALLIEGEESIKQHGYSTKTMDDIRKEVLVRKGLNG